jgi:solute carrier family 7 (L-type amino acid transporter), member 9/15
MIMSQIADTDGAEERPLLADTEVRDYAPAQQSDASEALEHGAFARNLGTADAFAIITSIVIGSGVFTSTGSIDTNVPSPGASLVIWLVGGVIAWTGATTVAELGLAIGGEGSLWKNSAQLPFGSLSYIGGVQPYLKHIYGDAFGFLAAWTWIFAVMPATLATLSIAFVEGIFTVAGRTDLAGSFGHKLMSIGTLVIMSLANSISTKVSTQLNSFFVTVKFVSILGVVAAGVMVMILQVSNPERHVGGRDWHERPWFGPRKTVTPDGREIDWTRVGPWELLGHYSTALYGALWAYSGWDKVMRSGTLLVVDRLVSSASLIVV